MPNVLYFMWRDKVHARITYDFITEEVTVENYVDNPLLLPFGVNKNPTMKDFEQFIRERCMPETRFEMKPLLKYLDIPAYDPWYIVKQNHGITPEDYGWIKYGEEDTTTYDEIKIRD